MEIRDAAVVLHLRFRLKPGMQEAFADYVREAFPVFEAACDCQGAVYEDASDPEEIDEVFYYRTDADHARAEKLIAEDPVHVALLARWRSLLDGPPRVEVQRRLL